MKSTGIVRKVDESGRVVIPIELRRTLGIEEKDALEIYTDNEKIVLKKYEPACIFCGSLDNASLFKGRIICDKCLAELRKADGDYNSWFSEYKNKPSFLYVSKMRVFVIYAF